MGNEDEPRQGQGDSQGQLPPRPGHAGTRAAWASIAVNVGLSLLNLAIAMASGSLAVAAEMVHNAVDLVSSVAVLLGVTISERKSRDFPYGLYKVENLVAAGISLLVFSAAYEILARAFLAPGGPTTVNGWMLGGVALSAVGPLAFSFYEMRVGKRLNSPSLLADAREYRVHVFSSGVVFLALLGHRLGFPLDRYAAVIVVLFITRTGWQLLVDAMRVLLDASLDAETLNQVRAILQADPAVVEVRSLVGRNAGRYRFLETVVTVRVHNLEKAHALSQRLEKAIRDRVPHVERVLIHYEPQVHTHRRYAVPLADMLGAISDHFGEAPYFALVTVRAADGQIERQEVLANPHQHDDKGKGIHVAEWLMGLQVDTVLPREDLTGKGPGYAFADAGVEVRRTEAATLAQAVSAETKARVSDPARGEMGQ
jgi:cation diffusion facilitator family transporter